MLLRWSQQQGVHKGHKINISFVKMILQYPHLKHKMSIGFFGWFVQYPNVGHKICMLSEKNDDNEKIEN
jgi:phage pi2 protein 07